MNNIYILSDKKVDKAKNIPIFEINFISKTIDFSQYDALIFTSKNAIKAIDTIDKKWKEKPSYAIAPQTAKTIKEFGGNLQFTGKTNHGDSFAKELLGKFKHQKLLYLRASKVVSNLTKILKCDEVVIYETVCKKIDKNITLPKHSTIIFSSPSTIDCFLQQIKWDKTFKAISIGKTTASFFPDYITPIIAETTSIESCVDKAIDIQNIYKQIKTPAYICEEHLLEQNLKILDYIQKKSGAKIILALKGFAMRATFPLISKYLYGATASGLHEAMLAKEEIQKEVHTYSPAFKDDEIDTIAQISDHIVFNTPSQLKKFKDRVKKINPNIEISIRINPEVSSSPVDIYNPCGLYSRLGTTSKNFDESIIPYLDGLNFHALCEQDADALEDILLSFEQKFSKYFKYIKYINFGGGHHITKDGYNIDKLILLIQKFKIKYNLDIYLEPGEAVGWETGVLVSSVLDIFNNGTDIAILDTSAEAHMPDTLAMPYRADIRGSSDDKKYRYRLGGNTCLAGDIMGDYSFDKKLKIGDKIIFEDQIHYTFVKNTTFNGIKLPSLALLKKDGSLEIVKEFNYQDYRDRL